MLPRLDMRTPSADQVALLLLAAVGCSESVAVPAVAPDAGPIVTDAADSAPAADAGPDPAPACQPLCASPPCLLAPDRRAPFRIVADGKAVYWTERGQNASGAVMRLQSGASDGRLTYDLERGSSKQTT